MDIKPDEIKKIKVVGDLNGDKVKMLVTKGGFHLFVGKKKASSKKTEALAASSHQAIGMHQLEKEFSDFKSIINKSEDEIQEKLNDCTEYLPNTLIKNGYELYTLKKHNDINFIMCQHGINVMDYTGKITDNELELFKNSITNNNCNPEILSKCMTKLVEIFVKENNINNIRIK